MRGARESWWEGVQRKGLESRRGDGGGSGGPAAPHAASSPVLPLLATGKAPFPLFPSLRLAFSFILLTILHGAVSDHMFYPLSPARRPYYTNLLSFPVT